MDRWCRCRVPVHPRSFSGFLQGARGHRERRQDRYSERRLTPPRLGPRPLPPQPPLARVHTNDAIPVRLLPKLPIGASAVTRRAVGCGRASLRVPWARTSALSRWVIGIESLCGPDFFGQISPVGNRVPPRRCPRSSLYLPIWSIMCRMTASRSPRKHQY